MNVIEPLIEEHRVIKKTLAVFETEMAAIREKQRIDSMSMEMSIDFIRAYADLVHHGKEENILFRELGRKNLSAEHFKIMNELLAEHKYSRSIIGRWMDLAERYFDGENTCQEIIGCLQELIIFYPQHIIKENKYFFGPVLEYFTREEQDKITREFEEFDYKILHWKYSKIESALKERLDTISRTTAIRQVASTH